MRIASDFGYSGREWRAVVVPLTVLVAAVSHRYLEAPIRSWARGRNNREPTLPAEMYRDETVETASVPS
jgi:peptidoglycan/LPS O-acetylase OafA/YrhL